MTSSRDFFTYTAGDVAINPAKPWQLCARQTGALCGQFATGEEAQAFLERLQAVCAAGTYPDVQGLLAQGG